MAEHWGVKGSEPHYWYPLMSVPTLPEVVVLCDDYWRDEIVNPGHIPDLLNGICSGPIIEIREWDWSCEVDISLLYPFYFISRGGEGLFTDKSLGWLIYASHEQSVSLGGERLRRSLDRVVPDWKSGKWEGWPDHSS